LKALDQEGIPSSPLHTLAELSEHPHTTESGMRFEYEHPELGTVRSIAQPLRLDGERTSFRRHAPALGEHNQSILEELGFSETQIRALQSAMLVQSIK
jgi:crotonobetainyl-CoA:carnitine CoA-transferase CaiB-like acyl-CoA transferase